MASEMLARLQTHLDQLQAEPSATTIDQKLVDDADLILPEQITKDELFSLVKHISITLSTLQQDPSPLTILLEKLLQPFTFGDVLAFEPPVDFVTGLALGGHLIAIQKLMIYLLQKARRPSDAATIANWPDVVRALIELWLRSPDTGIAARAGRLIVNLLQVDQPIIINSDQRIPESGTGQGLMWKRMFGDRDVYGTIFSSCDLSSVSPTMSKNQISLAQARLLDILPRIAAMDWKAVSISHFEDIEARHKSSHGSLLDFAALRMVDYKDDILSYRVLLDFYMELLKTGGIKVIPVASTEHNQGLEYLIQSGIHEKVAGLYLQQDDDSDPIEVMLLQGSAANYVANYASLYIRHFLESDMPKRVLRRLNNAFSLSAARWAHTDSPKHDLHVVASLPRMSVLPSSGTDWSASPVSLLPSRATSPDVLHTLAVIFHGPQDEIITFPAQSPMVDTDHESKAQEAAAARALYLNYLANNRVFWKDVVNHADTVALEDLALAALHVLQAVITANWSTDVELLLPSAAIPLPETGYMAILSPPALEYALPYLMKPPQTFSNLVGGRGDAESAAYKIAMAKYEALRAFHSKLRSHVESNPDSGFEDVLATLGKRLAEGPMSRGDEVGGRIATLEL